ncbi:MAG: hypothetical protein FWH11_05195 [Micrococcales bacterium]|nr:hypothetical protein [Micrococcales bacterium]
MRFVRAVAAGLVLSAVVWFGAGPAAADEEDGNWWYEQQEVAQAHARWLTGKGVPVAVIALGIKPDMPVLADANLAVREPSFCLEELIAGLDHLEPVPAAFEDGFVSTAEAGSNAVAFIAGNGRGPGGRVSLPGIAPDADVRFYAVGYQHLPNGECVGPEASERAAARAIVQAVDDGARIVLLIDEGRVQPDAQVSQAVAYALHQRVVLVVPVAGGSWVEALNGVVAVGASGADGWELGGSAVAVSAPGVEVLVEDLDFDRTLGVVSSRPSAAIVAGMLAVVAQRWPQATNDQLIQTLLASAASPVPRSDGQVGRGVVDLPRMLRVDPTQYPDRNPLIVPDDGRRHGLTAEEIRSAGRPAWADPLPGPARAGSHGTSVWVLFAVGSAAAVAGGLLARHVLSVRAVDSPAQQGDISTQQEE